MFKLVILAMACFISIAMSSCTHLNRLYWEPKTLNVGESIHQDIQLIQISDSQTAKLKLGKHIIHLKTKQRQSIPWGQIWIEKIDLVNQTVTIHGYYHNCH